MPSVGSLITVAPRPRWRDLMVALVPRSAESKDLRWPGVDDMIVHGLSRAAWGLVAIAEYLHERLGRPPVFWVPGYFCNQSLAPLRGTSAIIRFYPVTEEAEPNWAACRRISAEGITPDVFVLVHTFGFSADVEEARRFADEYGAWLVEDAAHVPGAIHRSDNVGDAVLMSPYKMLPIPHGGLLALRRNDAANGIAAKIGELGDGWPSVWPWLFRRAVEVGLPEELRRRLSARRGQMDFDTDPEDRPCDSAHLMAPVSRRLLDFMVPNLNVYAEKRRRNVSFLASRPWPQGCVPFRNPEAPGVVPYRFVLRCRDHETARLLFGRLRNAGIPAESWPDLPPEVLADGQRHIQAITLRRTLVLIPVHQDLSPDILARALNEL